MPRKQYTIHYIYKTTNIITGKFYIGMHSTFNLDDNYIGSGKYLWNSIRKYGKENHKKEILEFCKNRNELKIREREIVNRDFIKNPLNMNIMEGGDGGFISTEQQAYRSSCGGKAYAERLRNDEDFKKRMSECRKIIFTERYKKGLHKNLKPNWIGKKHTLETIEKMKISHKGMGAGKLNSQYGTMWIYSNILKISKKILKTDVIPNGWIKGRKYNCN